MSAHARKCHERRQAAEQIGTPSRGTACLTKPPCDHQSGQGQHEGCDEQPAPRQPVDERAADERSQRRNGGSQRDERTDRSVAAVPGIGGRDQCQSGSKEHGRCDALQRTTRDEQANVEGGRAHHGADAEQGQADGEHPAMADDVPHRSSDEYECDERDVVRVEDPLNIRGSRIQVTGEGWNGRLSMVSLCRPTPCRARPRGARAANASPSDPQALAPAEPCRRAPPPPGSSLAVRHATAFVRGGSRGGWRPLPRRRQRAHAPTVAGSGRPAVSRTTSR